MAHNTDTSFLDKLGRKYHQGDDGDIWFPYIYEYESGGKKFGLTLWARNPEEAERLTEDIKNSLKLSGEIIEEIPA